jgi:hypothetical protein
MLGRLAILTEKMEFLYEPEGQFDLALLGVISKGHGVASGQAVNTPYPEGTLAPQIPLFRELGVDLSGFFRGTLNIDVSPRRIKLRNGDVTLRQVRWTNWIPPEDFSFFACLLEVDDVRYRSLIYRPHPETKVEHFQKDAVLEVLSPWVEGMTGGKEVRLKLRSSQIESLNHE